MWLICSTVTILINVVLLIWYRKFIRKFKDIEENIPGPPPQIIFGNIAEFGNNVEESFHGGQRLIKTYGPLVRLWQGPFRVILLLANPDHVEYFLTSMVHITKSRGYQPHHDWVGQGLVTSTGEKWKKHRRILTPAFHFKILEEFMGVFHKAGQILIDDLKIVQGKPVDGYEYCVRYAVETICASAMKVRFSSDQEDRIDDFIQTSRTYMHIFFRRFFSAIMQNKYLFRFFPEYKIHRQCVAGLHKFSTDVIERRKLEKMSDFDGRKKKAFLDILLDSNELTDTDIREEVDTVLFAGHDTIGSALGFSLYELAKHQDVQNKILDEIHDVIGSEKNKEITMRDLNEMTFLDCVVKEILRLHTVVPIFEREVLEDVVLDGMKIPSGTTISINAYAMHHNEKLFPKPEQFDPDRFLPHNSRNRHPFAYVPFSAGPRNCIGFKYALMNCKATIVNVVRNFELRPVPGHVPKLANAAVLFSSNGLPVIFQVRN